MTAARNRYTVPFELARHTVRTRLRTTRVAIVADEQVVAEQPQPPGRVKAVYDKQHDVPLVQSKPGTLRNGSPS